jgi:mRNA-degrading endonuclease RelE of RelBE toxin-antitoxin system
VNNYIIINLTRNTNMDTLKKFELMEKIVRELEDLQHSQTAIIQKLGKIEVDNIELSDKKLDKDLPEKHPGLFR